MKDILRQACVIFTILATLIVNGLANALPLNGKTTGEISNRFDVYFVPAGYVFSIWGLIYLGLVVFAVYQALPSQSQNPCLRTAGWWVSLSGLANIAWLFLWHYEQFPLTLVAILVLLFSLIMTYLCLETGITTVSAGEQWAVRLPFSIYLGWITVATVANFSTVLVAENWDGFGIAAEIWMMIILIVVLVITALMNFTRRDVAYTAVILWALAGISLKHAAMAVVSVSSWITFGLVLLSLAAALFTRKPEKKIG